MTPLAIGLLGILVLLILFMLSVPVGFAMALVGVVGFSLIVSPEAGLSVLARDFFEKFSAYSLTVIPMFIFMGSLAFASGMSSRLYDASHRFFGHMRGGLALATIAACAGFAAICGSTAATAAAMGQVALPEMKRYNYDDSLSTGTVAAAGSLGILIPPSTIFMVYGIMTEQSIGKLFLAGIFPGILLAGFFAGVVIILAWRNPALAPAGQATTWKEKIQGLSGVTETLLLFAFVIGGMFLGWFSPMQAGAIGAAGALVVGLVRRQLTWQKFVFAVKDTLRITCEVMIIVAGATVFGHFMAVSKMPFMLTEWVAALNMPAFAVMSGLILVFVIGGTFMDSLAMVTLMVPIVYPVVLAMGFDPIWFGVIIVLVTEIGVITPPLGLNVYVVKGIAGNVSLETIFKGILPFLVALIVAVIVLLLFPQIATFLPGLSR